MKKLLLVFVLMISMSISQTNVSAQEDWISVSTIAWNNAGDRLAVGANIGVKVFDIRRETPELLWEQDTDLWVRELTFSPDDAWLASGMWGGSSGDVVVWKADSGAKVAAWTANSVTISAIAFSPDGQYMITGGGLSPTRIGGDYDLRKWNTATWEEEPALFQSGGGQIDDIIITPDSILYAFTSSQRPTRIVDFESNITLAMIHDTSSGCMAFDDDSHGLFVGLRYAFQHWEFRNSPEFYLVRTLDWRIPYSTEPNDTRVYDETIIGCSANYFATRGHRRLNIYDSTTTQLLHTLILEDICCVSNVRFHPYDDRIAFICEIADPQNQQTEEQVMIWNFDRNTTVNITVD